MLSQAQAQAVIDDIRLVLKKHEVTLLAECRAEGIPGEFAILTAFEAGQIDPGEIITNRATLHPVSGDGYTVQAITPYQDETSEEKTGSAGSPGKVYQE